MTAYAALVSLINITEQIQNHTLYSFCFNKKQIESLHVKIDFFLDFMENYSHGGSKEAQVLEGQIASVAYAAEDAIESHVVDHILDGSTKRRRKKRSISLLDIQKLIKEMDSIKEKLVRVIKDQRPTYNSTPAASSRSPLTAGNNNMVGFDEELVQLMDVLTGQQSNRLIIPIVGMGGIGKTTLARNVYENSLIVQHFDICAWATVSQEYSVGEILVQLLSCERKSTITHDTVGKYEIHQLGDQLHKRLSGRRYLIVLDDIWDIEAWDNLKLFLPNNHNRSRIVVTTRLSNLAIHFSSSCLAMKFLDEDKSWIVFCEKAFAQEGGCPPELEEIGKKIVERCNGLPLSIVVIGGLIGKSNMTQEYLEYIAANIHRTLNSGEDEQCMNVLSLSYRHLPPHLRSCFLYMGIFPEDHEIRVSRLIKLWVAEGFLKPNEAQSLEEIAECYLKDLIDRSLVLVRESGPTGKVKTCGIHDLVRNMCIRVAEKEKFLCLMRVQEIRRGGIHMERRIVFHARPYYSHRVSHALQSASRARSLTCELGVAISFKFRLLRVLNVVNIDSLEATLLQQVNLRYLACLPIWLPSFELPPSISLLWNVQTLIIRGGNERFFAPPEIWNMPQLRHMDFDEISFPDPQKDGFVLQSLQTLKRVVNLRLSEVVCRRIPNVKKLHISYDDFSSSSCDYCLYNICRLSKLESLNCSFEANPYREDLLENLKFPSSLRKLSLLNCNLHWEDLTVVGILPHLEVLKLGSGSVRGSEWNLREGEFLCLKFLEISCCNLVNWNADNSHFHFPVLENLILFGLDELDEIPLTIGDIPTLGVISLHRCSESAAISAIKILDEQESLENEGLRIRVRFLEKEQLERFMKDAEQFESFRSNNLQLTWGWG